MTLYRKYEIKFGLKDSTGVPIWYREIHTVYISLFLVTFINTMVCRKKLKCNNNIITKQSAMQCTIFTTQERERERERDGGGRERRGEGGGEKEYSRLVIVV